MKARLLTIFTALATLTSTACGGGTIGTGLGTRGAEFAGSTGGANSALSLTLHATIKSSSGALISGSTLRVTSSINTYACVTAKDGTCEMRIRIPLGEPVSLSVERKNAAYRSEEYLSPAGASRISRTFVIRPDGTIETQEP
jgi:hypothetical protein